MRLIGKEKLQELMQTDNSACTWIRAWVAELASANWKQPLDVSNQFPNVRQKKTDHFVFPISNCNKEVHLQIAFQQNIAVITDLQ